jgi:membrane protease YdiL (CAAX protease family)
MLLLFFIIAYLVAWLLFITASLISDNTQLSTLSQVLIFIGAISPGFVAILITAKTQGAEGVKLLINKISFKDTNVMWYVFAITFIALIKGLAALVFFLIYNSWPQFGTTSWYVMLGAIAVSMWVQAGEEIGWRGYALPLMSKKFGLAMSSILLGVIWATWHLPLFYLEAADTFHQSFPLYLLQVTGLSVIMAWLLWKVNGNLLPLMVFHAAINNTKDIVPSASKASASPFTLNGSPIGWISVALIWIAAFYVIYAMTRKPAPTIPDRAI